MLYKDRKISQLIVSNSNLYFCYYTKFSQAVNITLLLVFFLVHLVLLGL